MDPNGDSDRRRIEGWVVERRVPVAPQRYGKYYSSRYPFRRMTEGESVLIPRQREGESLTDLQRRIRKCLPVGQAHLFISRNRVEEQDGEEGVRFWKISRADLEEGS